MDNDDVKEHSPAHGVFGDSPLVEIIHLHDCFRGALKNLELDVSELCHAINIAECEESTQDKVTDLHGRVAGRLNVIWTVFRAHSSAEDEFIWPALKAKQPNCQPNCDCKHPEPHEPNCTGIEQEEYEEDHADEERMFKSISSLLSNLRETLSKRNAAISNNAPDVAKQLLEDTKSLRHHLVKHLVKEETHCMPLVAQYLTKVEINDLVGKIMGKRSSELMSQILTMAVQNLDKSERDDMIRYMKEAMVGTFFERWLKVAMPKPDSKDDGGGKIPPAETTEPDVASSSLDNLTDHSKPSTVAISATAAMAEGSQDQARAYTSAAELEKLIRAIGTNPRLDADSKMRTIQGLRDSVWKSNCRVSKRKREEETCSGVTSGQLVGMNLAAGSSAAAGHRNLNEPAPVASRFKRNTPPSAYYKKNANGVAVLVWSSDPNSSKYLPNEKVPLFSASELAPTYHDGGINHTLGCPHYARSCKIRHPTSGKLYTCRLCCEQSREMSTEDIHREAPLDRYEVKEVLCMICNTLQPAGDKCVNPNCGSSGKPFAKYSCNICNLHSGNKSIYHCPFCNVCRQGKGLGIDYRHCMRCNACVSMNEEHICIPQSLQGDCPICHEPMFESTQPLRGLNCGHVMHLSCFTRYAASGSYTCPLCKKSSDDMTEYFALLDAAVRMQPMPPAYANQTSNFYCQDCNKMGNVQYHFVGLKCHHCGSYNTRELQRVNPNITS